MCIRDRAYIPDYAVVRSIEYVVQGNGQLYRCLLYTSVFVLNQYLLFLAVFRFNHLAGHLDSVVGTSHLAQTASYTQMCIRDRVWTVNRGKAHAFGLC